MSDSESMIERVAEALCREWSAAARLPITGDVRRFYTDAARAAIEAMREPTEEMVEIGFVVERASENNPATYDDPISLVAYKAMIAAALGDHP